MAMHQSRIHCNIGRRFIMVHFLVRAIITYRYCCSSKCQGIMCPVPINIFFINETEFRVKKVGTG